MATERSVDVVMVGTMPSRRSYDARNAGLRRLGLVGLLAAPHAACFSAPADDTGGDDVTLVADAAAADAAIGDGLASLTDPQWVALCEGVYAATPSAQEGQGNLTCLDQDCVVSPTAVQDCAVATPPAPLACAAPDDSDPLRDCGAAVELGQQCLVALLGQFDAYATMTCANRAALAPLSFDLVAFSACDPLVAACPDLVAAPR